MVPVVVPNRFHRWFQKWFPIGYARACPSRPHIKPSLPVVPTVASYATQHRERQGGWV